MPLDYTLETLKCWSCPENFAVFTDLSNHHLTAHERPLARYAVTDLLVRTAPDAPSEDCYVCHHDRLASLVCSRCGPACVACRIRQEEAPARELWCRCGCLYEVHRGITAEEPLQPCFYCACRAFVLRLSPAVSETAPPPAREVMCACGCLYEAHSWGEADAPDHPCLACHCRVFVEAVPPPSGWPPHSNNPAALSALQQFWRLCQVEGLSYQELAARLILDRLGVSPDAPVIGCEAAVQEALTRWRDGVALNAPPTRWMWGTAQGCPHEYAHVEMPGCVEAGCVPTGKAVPHEP